MKYSFTTISLITIIVAEVQSYPGLDDKPDPNTNKINFLSVAFKKK